MPGLEGVLERYTAGPKSGVFTDGSCEGNPGPGGWGFVWVEDDAIVAQKSGRDPGTTNNRMELTALIEAFRALPSDAAVTVYSDSELCVKTVNEWAAGWERRGWRRKTGPDQEPRAGAGALGGGEAPPEGDAALDPRARRLALERVRRRARGELARHADRGRSLDFQIVRFAPEGGRHATRSRRSRSAR